MAKRNIKLIVEYRGTDFAGWQFQPNQSTIQGSIVEAIEKVTQQRVNLIGAGRTDAGVHALGQVANFRIEHKLESSRFAAALNYYLSDDIRIKSSEEVGFDFHATRDARFRRYRYLLSGEKSALYRDLRWECGLELEIGELNRLAGLLVGRHDFSPFCVVSSLKEDNHCQIEMARWRRIGPLWVFEIRGNRFLHNMVRGLVGSMVNIVGKPRDHNAGNLTFEMFSDIINDKIPAGSEPTRVGFTAPACGLYLVGVGY